MNIDFVIVSVYLVAMLCLAWWYRRSAGKNMETFFLGGRKIPGWLNGISYAAALVSPDAATGYGGLAVVSGAFISWWYLSRFGLALFLGGVLFAVFWRRLNLFTSLEFYDLRFTPKTAAAMRLWIAVRTSLIAMPAWTGITLLAACKIMNPVLHLTNMQTLALILPVAIIYVFLSGYRGVVISNFIQMSIFFAGTLMLAILTVQHFGGFTAMANSLMLHYHDTAPEILDIIPPVKHAVFPLPAALAWLAGQSIGYGGDAAPVGGAMEGQRILSTRTPSEALTMYVIAALSMFLLLLLVTLPSISAAALWPELRGVNADRELVYGRLMKTLLPAGAIGLMAAAMMAATMSVVADNLSFGSQVLVSDIYRKWVHPRGTEKHYLWMGKSAMILIVILSVLVVFNVRIIMDVAIFMLQLSAAELPANWAQWWWQRFNSAARLAASFGGAAIFCIVVLLPRALASLGVLAPETFAIPWYWQTLLVMGLTTLLWVTVALLTKPDPPYLLQSFYNRALPLGWWNKYNTAHRQVAGEIPSRPILRGIFIAIAGAAATALMITSLTEAWFGRYIPAVLQLCLSVILFIIFSKSSKKYLQFLSVRAGDEPAP